MSAIQAELLEATGVKEKKNEKRQEFLHRLLDKAEDLDDDTWKGLSTETQTWMNEQATKIKKDGEDAELDDFPDLEEEESEEEAAEEETAEDDADEADDDEESDDSEEADEESDDEEGAEEEEDEESTNNDEEESDVDEETTSKKTPAKKTAKAPAKKAAKPEKAAPAKKVAKAEKKPAEKKAAAGPKSTGIKVKIKKMVFKKPSISVDDLMEHLGKDGVKPSKLTVSAIRSEFRHSLFVLRDLDALKGDVKL